MYSDQLAALDRSALQRLKEDLEQESVSVRQEYARQCRPESVDTTRTWESHHAEAVAARDAGLARVKYQIRAVNLALVAKLEAKVAEKAAAKALKRGRS
jgi:hypothetical protein